MEGKEISDTQLFEIFEIFLPLEPMRDLADNELDFNEMYFLFEQLGFLNDLLALAAKYEIAEIGSVRLEEPMYLVNQGQSGLPWGISPAGGASMP